MPAVNAFYDAMTSTLTYVVWNELSLDAVVIDPVLDYDSASSLCSENSAGEVIQFLHSQGLTLHLILETHVHADHLSAAPVFKREFPKARTAIGANIVKVQKLFKEQLQLPEEFKVDGSQFDLLLKDAEAISAGELQFKVLFTPGHTPACACYLFDEECVFTGDTLFMPDFGSGRCDFPGGSARDLYHSIHNCLYQLPEAVKAYVGHDYKPNGRPLRFESTIAEEKQTNIHLRYDTAEEEFVRFRSERDKTLSPPKLYLPAVRVNIGYDRPKA